MTYFTNNPLERMMMQKPSPGKDKAPVITAPKGHHCYGCARYGEGCVLPCFRDINAMRKEQKNVSRDR